MPASSDPNLGLKYGWNTGESGWGADMDANLKRIGALVCLSVINRTTTTPPANPANGDRYIIPSGASGAWSGKTNQVAVRVANAWEYYVPKVGWLAYIEDEEVLCVYKTTGWSSGIAM